MWVLMYRALLHAKQHRQNYIVEYGIPQNHIIRCKFQANAQKPVWTAAQNRTVV